MPANCCERLSMKLHYIANFRLYEPLKIPFVRFQANTDITTLETETKKYFVNTLNTYWSNTALYSKTTIKVFAFCLDEKQATLNHVETQPMPSFYPKFFHRNNVKYKKILVKLHRYLSNTDRNETEDISNFMNTETPSNQFWSDKLLFFRKVANLNDTRLHRGHGFTNSIKYFSWTRIFNWDLHAKKLKELWNKLSFTYLYRETACATEQSSNRVEYKWLVLQLCFRLFTYPPVRLMLKIRTINRSIESTSRASFN